MKNKTPSWKRLGVFVFRLALTCYSAINLHKVDCPDSIRHILVAHLLRRPAKAVQILLQRNLSQSSCCSGGYAAALLKANLLHPHVRVGRKCSRHFNDISSIHGGHTPPGSQLRRKTTCLGGLFLYLGFGKCNVTFIIATGNLYSVSVR